MSFNVQIIADSKNYYGNRLTTFLLTFPRMILAEFNTHRVVSRNSASSRAIPFEKMVEAVKTNPFIPLRWMKDHKGMQGTEYFTEKDLCDNSELQTYTIPSVLKESWLKARDQAVESARQMSLLGLTKQVCNRLLEPFMWHTVIATASEWENFFALRANDAAEIHMQHLAYMMLEAYNNSQPKVLKPDEWHIPFGDQIDTAENADALSEVMLPELQKGEKSALDILQELKVKIAVARCARVSYTVVGEENSASNFSNDIKLHDRLLTSGHCSPFEHCARVMTFSEHGNAVSDGAAKHNIMDNEIEHGWCGNFRGFIQYRKMLPNENRKDERVKQHELIID